MLRQIFCGAHRATLAFVTTATVLADALTKALVHCPSLLAAMNARRDVFVTSDSSTGVKTTLPMPSELALLIRSAEPQSNDSHLAAFPFQVGMSLRSTEPASAATLLLQWSASSDAAVAPGDGQLSSKFLSAVRPTE